MLRGWKDVQSSTSHSDMHFHLTEILTKIDSNTCHNSSQAIPHPVCATQNEKFALSNKLKISENIIYVI